MTNFDGMRGAIAYEKNIVAQLASEGWTGPVDILRTLAKLGEKLQQRYANSCSYEWACTESYERNTERAEARIREICQASGLSLYLQTDPRGATVYVCGPSGEMTPRNYSTRGHCLFFAR